MIVPRAEHTLTRRDIDPDALKVLYRLHDFNYAAYLVGGGVRDLLLGRRPKDFDVGTDAHPYQIKKLFRNCWIIGRRFRLAHVRFGNKAIEVATFRRNVVVEPAEWPEGEPGAGPAAARREDAEASAAEGVRHDNTFGTAEEDAFRRDFTINALFYDIATFSIIDYVGGLEDLESGLIRSIGEPGQRFREDPVRMLRAVAMASRLEFRLDPPIVEAIREHRQLMALAAPARLVEEFYKILRSAAAERTFRMLAAHGLLDPVTPELQRRATHEPLWQSLAALDAYRRRFAEMPPQLTNPILLGSLLLPLGLMPRAHATDEPEEAVEDEARPRARGWTSGRRDRRPKAPVLKIGMLPIARRDSERLRQLLSVQGRLRDLESSARTKRALMNRGPFEDALAWLDIHGQASEIVEHWRGFIEAVGTEPAPPEASGSEPAADARRRRRRRGGRRRGRQAPPTGES